MQITESQKKTSQAIVNIFETGSPQGNYGKVTLIPGDPGHLTYGRAQTTLSSGNLYLLIRDYCTRENAALKDRLSNYLDRLAIRDTSLDKDEVFRRLLEEAGHDPVMQEAQDQFFDRIYWIPAVNIAEKMGIIKALSVCVLYDSRIHGSWNTVRNLTEQKLGKFTPESEEKWIACYVETRRSWLANHSIKILRKTVYRMDAFLQLIRENNWSLDLPLWVCGIRIDESTITGSFIRASAMVTEQRLLMLTLPYQKGDDVLQVQKALRERGYNIEADGVFGQETDRAVRDFQRRQGLIVDGIVGPATREKLGIED